MKNNTLFFIDVAFLLTGCMVDVPDTDIVPPTLSFRSGAITFNHTFDQDDDFSSFELHLRRGHEYNFTLSGGDSGGLKDLRWLWFNSPSGRIDTDIPAENITEGWFVTPGGYVWFIGDRENALSGAIIAASFSPGGGYPTGRMDLELFAQDFGGLNGDNNYVEKILKVVIGDHPTAIVSVN